MNQPVETFTPAELAGELGIPTRIVLNAIKCHQLRCIRYSAKTIRILSKDAARWVDSLTK